MAMATKSQSLRKARVRKALAARGALRPRLSVFRSSKNIYAQIIDDTKGVTVAAASSLEKDLKGKIKTGADKDAAAAIGKLIAERDGRVRDMVFRVRRGTLGAARSMNPNSANSQFFINFKDNHFLNGQYTVYGRVIAGMEFVDKIMRGEPPANPDRMVTVRVAADVQ